MTISSGIPGGPTGPGPIIRGPKSSMEAASRNNAIGMGPQLYSISSQFSIDRSVESAMRTVRAFYDRTNVI